MVAASSPTISTGVAPDVLAGDERRAAVRAAMRSRRQTRLTSGSTPPGGPGGVSDVGLVGVGLAAARPDERVALAVFVVEEVRVDRSVEARVVQLDRQVVAAFVGALGPGGADLGLMRCNA